MVKAELIKRSPLRILEKSIHGGVGVGKVGVIASPTGVGKTACLVHIATDKLFQGKHVIHLSFATRTDHIIDWYEMIFKEIAKKRELESAIDVHDELIKNRVILNFSQHGIGSEQILKSISALISDGHFEAEVIMIDGYDFDKDDKNTLSQLKQFAAEHNITIWATADYPSSDSFDERGVPASLQEHIDDVAVLVCLDSEDDHIKLNLVKDHDRYVDEDLHLKLERSTLLIAEE